MVEVFCSVRIGVGVGGVGNRGGAVVSGGGNASVADDGARWRDCCSSPMGFSESSWKASHIVFHSRSISVISLRRLACKEEVV